MKQVGKSVVAISAIACAGMFSLGWSGPAGVSLSVQSAQARVGRPLTPVSVAGVARRHNRRGYGYGVAGAAAVGAAAGVAAAPYYAGAGYGGPYYHGPYSGGPHQYGMDDSAGPYASYRGYTAEDYATRNGFICRPGSMVKLDDGLMYRCQ